MPKENQPSTIPELTQKKDELSDIRNTRQRWRDAFVSHAGTGTPVEDLRDARGIATADARILRLTDKIDLISATIHQQQFDSLHAVLPQLREYAAKGQFPEEVLVKREAEYNQLLEQRSSQDIQHGYSLMSAEITPPVDKVPGNQETPKVTDVQRTVPSTSPDSQDLKEEKEPQLITVGITTDNGVKYYTFKKDSVQVSVLKYFSEHPGEMISSTQLKKDVLETAMYKPGYYIGKIREKIEEDSAHPKLLITHGSRKTTQYQFNGPIEFLEEDDGTKVENAPTSGNSPEEKNVLPFNSAESQDEEKVELPQAGDTDKESTHEVNKLNEKILSSFEAASLCHIFQYFKGVPVVVGSESIFPFSDTEYLNTLSETFEADIDEVPIFVSVPRQSTIRQSQLDLVKKLESIFNGNELDTVLDHQENHIQDLLIWIYNVNHDQMAGHLFPYLESLIRTEKAFEEKKIPKRLEKWMAPKELREALEQKNSNASPIEVQALPGVATKAEETLLENPQQEELPPVEEGSGTVEKSPTKVKLTSLERRVPDVRFKVEKIVKGVQEQLPADSSSPQKVTRAYNSIYQSYQDKMEERGHVSPVLRNGMKYYSQEDICTLIFLKENRISLDKKTVEELKNLIRRELAFQEEKAQD